MIEKIRFNSTAQQLFIFIAIAYLFSLLVRMIWVYQFSGYDDFMWNDQLMINTNDGYYFASGVQNALDGLHHENPRVASLYDYGLVALSSFLVKVTPFSLESILLYLPAFISSLIVVPIILIGRMFGDMLWGFFAALLGSIAWSYYNRTMVGYYDTDMFAVMMPLFIIYFLMKSTIDLELKTIFYGTFFVVLYPFFYDQGASVLYSIVLLYTLYMLFYHRKEKVSYEMLILLFLALTPLGIEKPALYFVKFLLLVVVYIVLKKREWRLKELIVSASVLFVLFLYFGNVVDLIVAKIVSYTVKGTDGAQDTLHFFMVNQTVREAGSIPFSTFANRISGSEIGLLAATVGYIVAVVKHRAFILSLPLVAIGIFALFGGLRFTVYAVPIAALSSIYLFVVIANYIDKKIFKVAFLFVMSSFMLYPNIKHIVEYKIPTVLNKTEVQDLQKLESIASSKDYTLAWWDYGYPIWYYSDTSTLIDGGKHQNDNFIISQLFFATSQQQVANFARFSVEEYISNGYKTVTKTLFKEKNPNDFLDELELSDVKLPQKSRDIYLYMPYRMLSIFPTVGMFSNLNLETGKKLRDIYFFPTQIRKQSSSKLYLANGMQLDLSKGYVKIGNNNLKITSLDIVTLDRKNHTHTQSKGYHFDGKMSVVFLKSYNKIIVMDNQTYNSAYVQMFMLGNYDKELFELVVASPYTKIYRVKK